MVDKTINIITTLKPEKAVAGAAKATKSLKELQDQANKTRESMAKLTEVGSKLALAGGALVAPLLLAMGKYTSTLKDTEPASKRILELSKKWEESQVRLGRVTAKIILPALEKGAEILEKVISFAEKNPGVVQAALTIGTTLVILGGIIATTAQLVQTVATIQGLAAAAGIGGVGAGAAAGAGGAGIGAALTAALTAAAPVIIPLLIAALVTAVVAPVVLGITNAIMGTNETMSDVWNTLKKLVWLVGYAWLDQLPKIIYSAFYAWGVAIGNQLRYIGDSIARLFGMGKASGGYMSSPGLYPIAENGQREFVLNANTTRNAERAIGGRLNQSSGMAAVTNNMQIGHGMTISQTRRLISNNNKQILGAMLSL